MVTFTIASYNECKIRETIDFILSLTTFETDVSLIFLGDSVKVALKESSQENLYSKDIYKYLKMLELFDVDKIFLEQNSLLKTDEFNDIVPWKIISSEQISEIINYSKHVISLK